MFNKILTNNIYLEQILKQIAHNYAIDYIADIDDDVEYNNEYIVISKQNSQLFIKYKEKITNKYTIETLSLPVDIGLLKLNLERIILNNTNISYNLSKYGIIFWPNHKKLVIEEDYVISLTEIENKIFLYLINNANRLVSLNELYKMILNIEKDLTTHTLENHIYNLRQKLRIYDKFDMINTINNYYIVELT